jgi:hypothetical protein
MQPHGLRQLDCERPHAAGSTVDQNALSRLHLARSETDKGRVGGEWDGSGLLKGNAGWHPGHDSLRGGDVLRDSRTGLTEDVVARPQPGHAFAHRLHRTGEVGAPNPDRRGSTAESRRIEQSSKLWLPAHNVPVPRVDRRGFDPDQDLSVAGNGRGDLIDPEDIGRAVAVLDERLHIPRSPTEPPPVVTIGDVGQR